MGIPEDNRAAIEALDSKLVAMQAQLQTAKNKIMQLHQRAVESIHELSKRIDQHDKLTEKIDSKAESAFTLAAEVYPFVKDQMNAKP